MSHENVRTQENQEAGREGEKRCNGINKFDKSQSNTNKSHVWHYLSPPLPLPHRNSRLCHHVDQIWSVGITSCVSPSYSHWVYILALALTPAHILTANNNLFTSFHEIFFPVAGPQLLFYCYVEYNRSFIKWNSLNDGHNNMWIYLWSTSFFVPYAHVLITHTHTVFCLSTVLFKCNVKERKCAIKNI